MSSNYEWLKQQSNERVQARLQEAKEHRRAKQGNSRSPLPLPLKIMVPALVGTIVAFWLLTG